MKLENKSASEDVASLPNKWAILATVAFGTFMATLDSSIVNIALPTIRNDFNAGDHVEWIVLSYLLATTSTLLIMGKLSDLFGRKSIYILGFSVFTFGSLLCGLAWDIWSLVIFRVVQGLGASMIFAIGPAIVSDAFIPKERGRALGLIGTVVAAGSSTGPVVGGILLQNFGWESIFLVNIPIGILAIWRAFLVLPSVPRSTHKKFDIVGAGLFFVGVTTLLIGIDFGPEPQYGWSSFLVITLIFLGLFLLSVFLLWEKNTHNPMLKLSLFKIWPYSSALLVAGMGFIASGANIYVIPFFLQQLLGFSPQDAGFIMLAGPLTLSIAAPIGGFLSEKISTRYISSFGLLVTAIGYLMLSFLREDWTWQDVVWRTALVSLGFGLFQSPNSSSALNSAPLPERGVASSLIAFMRNLGLVLGIALGAATWYSVRNNYSIDHNVDPLSSMAQAEGMQTVYKVISALVFVAAFISLLRGGVPRFKTAPENLTIKSLSD